MAKNAEDLLGEVLESYDFGGEVVGAVRYGSGHINDTFCVYAQAENGDCKRFILQRIKTATFKDPTGLMNNICGVTEHLRAKIEKDNGDIMRETINVVHTKVGEQYYTDTENGAWRVYVFVEDSICLQKVRNAQDFYEVAVAFGNFQKLLSDYPADTLVETIENFHNTPDRYAKFIAALEADVMGRAKNVQAEIDFVKEREKDCSVLADLLADGKIPLRVTHNDTKLNNVLLDKSTEKGICVIDLDTVMPGLSLHDFGDAIRFGANDCDEDEKDISKVNFSLSLYKTFADGFLAASGGALTDIEIEHLPWGAKLMTLECGMRFLTDYLDGDNYFKIHRDGHNLDRCRTQFKLVSDMENNWEEMKKTVEV